MDEEERSMEKEVNREGKEGKRTNKDGKEIRTQVNKP